jgi:aldose 1-epimerase
LEDLEAGCASEIAAETGCNCFRWFDSAKDLLYADPEVFPGGRPTRSGIPILFPFPNRLDGGCFTWEGKVYQLPLTDSSGKHAIHGFACRNPWRVTGQGGDAESAWLRAEFHAALDAPESRSRWPADYQIAVTFRLGRQRLRLETTIENSDRATLPFGLGFHPYFRLESQRTLVTAPARSFWELRDSMPTGRRLPVDSARNLNTARPASELQLDDLLTDLPGDRVNSEGLMFRGQVGHVALWTSPAFRELVAFTPPHRHAVCLEPYTCTTNAANLQPRGIDAGWLTLPPGKQWSAVFEMTVTAS